MKVKELLAKQVAFEEAVWTIRDILWNASDILERTKPLVSVLEESTRHFTPRTWEDWGNVSVPATVEAEDLSVIKALIEAHEDAGTPDAETLRVLLQVVENASVDCPWAEQAFGQRYLFEQVGRLGIDDPHATLIRLYEATEPSHPTAGKLSKAVFGRLAADYPAEEYPEMIMLAQNILLAGFLEEI